MSLISKEDKHLSKRASGLPDSQPHWKNSAPTPVPIPSNDKHGAHPRVKNFYPVFPKRRITAPILQIHNPYSKPRFKDNSNASSGMRYTGNPNRGAAVFSNPSRQSKRPKTQSTSAPRQSIDLTTEDTQQCPRSLVDAEDSDDSLNLKHPKERIAHDGPATRRLSERTDAGSSKVVHSDTETELIEDFPEDTKKPKGVVRAKVNWFEALKPPKLPLDPSTPLGHLRSEKPRSKQMLNMLLTDPTTFTHKNKNRGKVISPLPLEEWIRGTERLLRPREYFLKWEIELNNPVLKVVSSQGHSEFKFVMNSGIERLQASGNGVSPLIIIFDVRTSPQSGSNDLHETVAFRVDTHNKTCNEPARKALFEFLKDKCRCKEWLDSGAASVVWSAVVMELDSATSESKQRESLPLQIPSDHENERQSSMSSPLPLSIELSPPPEGEIFSPPKTSQKIERMNHRPIIQEQRETPETAKDEPIAGPSNKPLRRSSRQSTAHSGVSAVGPTRTSPSEDPDELMLVYRPSGTGAVNITRGDFERLQPGKYLNDTLIEFGLKLWLSDLRDRNPELANQIHLFSSFFYKKLAIKDKMAGYDSVRKWTSKVDVFSKKYLVVPINEHLHWYLAIIYQPEYTLRLAQPPPSPLTRKRKRDEEVSIEASHSRETLTIASKSTSKATTETPERSEIEVIPDSEPSSPKMELEEQTQTDETTKPEEQEVESQLCAEVSSVSLDEQEGSHFWKGEQDDSVRASRVDQEGMEIDNSPPASPMPVDREVHIEESTSLEIVEPSILAEETAPGPPVVEMEDSFDLDTIPVEGFYGSRSIPSKTYGQKKSRASAPGKLEGGSLGAESGGGVKTTPLETDRTYIFIFDSLNGKHPGAMRNLVQYLRFEAMDKKGIENPSSPASLAALVPTQDNHWDCGLYLLHFAKVFMGDPAKSFHTILTKRKSPKAERDVDWKKELVGTSRGDLTARILDLSAEWIRERVREEEEKAKAKAKERESASKPDSIAIDSHEESDDDVILEEVVAPKPDPAKKSAAKRPESTRKGPVGRGKGRTSPQAETRRTEPKPTAANRLR